MTAAPALLVKCVRRDVEVPSYGSPDSIGLDLVNAGDHFELLHLARRKVPTGLAFSFPAGYYGRIAPRSGLADRNGLHVLAGAIDPDYRGEVSIILINLGGSRVVIRKGARIAQLILERADQATVQLVDELPGTERGAGGFGSTGL